jgi:alpha/beta superfamily hydrolase
MGLPGPTLAFTIPSVYDDTTLDCRVYHPVEDSAYTSTHGKRVKRKQCAIVAHPYAPLGGCCDDPVVGIVAGQILKDGFIVCTFNFRYTSL